MARNAHVDTAGLFVADGDDAVVLSVHAQPGAGRTHVVGRHGDAVKIRVAAPPEHGRANDALVKVLAESFGVKEAFVELKSGASSREKRFRISGLKPDAFDTKLETLLELAGRRPGR
ncbi:MAG: DUF167 domain-containing protein [Acidimicrobiales bacterium]